MVVPCYNKAKHISAMLDSVINQEWNNIELILVNDGSTDGTREIISDYESKLERRGYDVIIIDQENAGCCAAVHAGLLRMRGDYYCLVDCDDMIEPKYVSRMAGWLDAYKDCEWAACTFRVVVHSEQNNNERPPGTKKFRPDAGKLLERHIFRTTFAATWIYMARVSYLKKCGMIDNFCTERRATYEPLIIAPLALGAGKLEFFNEPLYIFNQDAMGLSRFDSIKQCVRYYKDYLYLYRWAIEKSSISDDRKQRLHEISRIGFYKDLYRHVPNLPKNEDYMPNIVQGLTHALNEIFKPAKLVDVEKLEAKGLRRVFDEIENAVIEGDGTYACKF